MSQSISLYHDLQTDYHYLLNNATGQRTKVNPNSEYEKAFDAVLTGQVGYKARVAYANAKSNPGYLPLKAPCLNPPRSTLFYTPQTDKLEGYTQFPQPVTSPYFNRTSTLKMDPLRRKEIRVQKQLFKPDSTYNSQLFHLDSLHQHNVGVTHLTDSLRDHLEQDTLHRVKVMGERSVTQYQDDATSPSRKIINGRSLLSPSHTQIMRYQLGQRNQSDGNLARTLKTLRQSVQVGQTYVEPLEREKYSKIETFAQEREARDKDFGHFSKASQFYNAKTFDGHSFSSPFREQPSVMKSVEQFDKELLQQIQQLESFKIPRVSEKNIVSTKGRYNVQVESIKVQDGKDRHISMLLYPTVERVDPRRQKQEELRRKINKMKEVEMLERNLRNKL